MLKIIQAPNSVLSAPAKKITNIDKSVKSLIRSMEETLVNARDPEGVGLAAPQIGKSLQLFLVKQTPRSPTLVFINPVIEEFIDTLKPEIVQSAKTAKIKEESKIDKNVQLEGCLSLNSIWGEVNRHPALILSYIDETGASHKKKFTGFLATIIQHEYDHLQGALFPKRVLEQQGKLYKSSLNKKGETEFEEIEL